MCKLILLVIMMTWLGFALLPASVVVAQESDLLGIFFDDMGNQTIINTTEPGQLISFYLVLLDPSHSEGIHSWECILESLSGAAPAPLLGWELSGEAINYDQPPRFFVSLATPLPPTGPVVLMSADVFVANPGTEVLFYLHPYDPPSLTNPPGSGYPVTTPLYGYGDDNLQSLGWTSGCESEPVARINDDGEDPVWSLDELPAEVLFGYVPAGETETRSLFLENTGDVVLSGQIDISGEGFMYRYSSSGIPWTDEQQWFQIEPEDQLWVQLRVVSAMDEEYTGELDITLCGETTTIALIKQGPNFNCTLDPPVLDFGEVDLYDPGPWTSHTTITNDGTEELWLVVNEDCPDFSAELLSWSSGPRLLPGQSCELWVTFDPSSLGPQTCTITLIYGCELVCTAVVVDSSPQCLVTPASWDFGEIAIGEADHHTFEVLNTGEHLLEGQVIIPASCSVFRLVDGTEPFSLAHDESHHFTVGFKPAETGSYACSVFVSADCDELGLSGMAVAYAESCSVEPELIDFGEVWLGYWRQHNLVISNHGTVSLTGDLQLNGFGQTMPEDFTLEDAGPFTLAPGENQIFNVRFTPPDIGRFDAFVTTGLPGCSMIPLVAWGVESHFDCWHYENGDAEIISSVGTPGWAESVAVAGSYAYVADGDSGLQVVEVTNPQYPQIIGSVVTPGSAKGVAVAGSHAYAATGYGPDYVGGLQVIDITDPESPWIAGSVDTPGYANDVAVLGNYAFCTSIIQGPGPGRGYFTVIDITDPGYPQIVGGDGGYGYCAFNGVAVSGSYAYVAVSSEFSFVLLVYNISDPGNPQVTGSINCVDWPCYLAQDVAVSGSYAYVAANMSSTAYADVLLVCNVSEPENPQIIGSVDLPGNAYGVAVAGDFTYMANGEFGLQVIDISVPESPTILGAMATPGDAGGIALDNHCAYVVDGGALHVAWQQCEDPVALKNDPEDANPDEEVPSTGPQFAVHPNPFNPQTTVTFSLEQAGWAKVGIYGLTGRRVAILSDQPFTLGTHTLTWNGQDSQGRAMPSGTYIVRLATEDGVEARKVMLVR